MNPAVQKSVQLEGAWIECIEGNTDLKRKARLRGRADEADGHGGTVRRCAAQPALATTPRTSNTATLPKPNTFLTQDTSKSSDSLT